MNTSSFLFVFLAFWFFEETNGKSGGGGGRGGGGRGHSGARGSFSRGFSSGGKFGGSSRLSSSFVSSSSFRSSVFTPSNSRSYFTPTRSSSSSSGGSVYVINQPYEPIVYDNHYYYWHGHYRSSPDKKTVCEYSITKDDGELFNVTYANGTTPKSMIFGCGSWEKCCGMTCCSSMGDWIGLSIWVFVVIAVIIYGCRREN